MRPRYRLSSYNQVVKIKRTCLINTVDFTFSGGWSTYFSLNQLPNSSDFTNLFDKYRIQGVKLRLLPNITDNNTGNANTLNIPRTHYCWDYDDYTAPSSLNSMLERDNVKIIQGNQVINTFSRPKVQMAMYNSATTSGYGDAIKGQWIDCTNDAVPHYGFKMWCDTDAVSTQVVRYKVYATFYLNFKAAL